MLYLIDANVLITAHSRYYGIETVPEFWEWLTYQGEQGRVKIPLECYDEILDGSNDQERDLLYAWTRDRENKAAIVLNEAVDAVNVERVVRQGYAPNLTDVEIEQIGQDPFLIAYALASPADRVVVTNEVSKPRSQRQNRHIPDVCRDFAIRCIDTFQMCRELAFSTRWAERMEHDDRAGAGPH